MDNSKDILTKGNSSQFPTSNQYIVYWIECVQNSQDINNNKTNVTVKVWCKRTNTGYETYGTGTCYCTINGTQYSTSITSSQKITSTPRVLFTKTIDIGHNGDGTKTLSMSSYINHERVSSSSHSYSQKLTTIPRTSTFTLNTDKLTIGETRCTVNIKRNSSSFTHKILYTFNGIKNYVIYSGGDTVKSFTPSLEDCSQLPNSISGVATITVETWNGNTKIGQVSKNVTMTVPNSLVPSVTGITAELVANGIDPVYGYLQNKSKVKLTVQGASGTYGSNITNYSVSGGGHSSNAVVSTTSILTQSGEIVYSAYVVDSRGRKSNTVTTAISVKAYSNPTILEFSAERCLINGEVSEEGTYAKVYTRYNYSDLAGGNRLEALIGYRKSGDTDFIVEQATPSTDGTILIGKINAGGNLDTSMSYEVMFTLRDNFTTVRQSRTIATSFVTLDFRKGGKGIAIGKASEQDGLFDINMDVNIKGKLTLNGKEVGKDEDIINANGIEVNTGSTSANTGIKVIGSNGVTGNWWSGTDGTVLQSIGSANLHLGQNNNTDMIFKSDAIEVNKFIRSKNTIESNFVPATNGCQFKAATNIDNNGQGDGNTHIGFKDSSGNFHHYFRGNGRMNINTLQGAYISNKIQTPSAFATDKMQIGEYRDKWQPLEFYRTIYDSNRRCKIGISGQSTKLSSSHSSENIRGLYLESNNTDGSVIRRYAFTDKCLMPGSDNNTYCGTSTHRWQALYCSTGTVYSSSALEKDNIIPIDTNTLNTKESSIVELIIDGIKSTNLYSYNYKILDNDSIFIGFLGQELAKSNPKFLRLFGSCYTREDTNVEQYDIREASVNGVLWTGIKYALNTIEKQQEQINTLEERLSVLEGKLGL